MLEGFTMQGLTITGTIATEKHTSILLNWLFLSSKDVIIGQMSDYRKMETQFIGQSKTRLFILLSTSKHPVCVREKRAT